MKQVFTLIEFEYDREVLPTEIQAAITKLLGVYPVKVERRPTKRAADETVCACGAKSFTLDVFPNHCGRCGKPFRR